MNYQHLITFTKAREKSDFWENGEHSKRRRPQICRVNTTGEEARRFYESLVNEREQSAARPHSRKRKVARRLPPEEPREGGSYRRPTTPAEEAKDERMGHQLLKCSQHGDLKGLKKLLEKEHCDINFRDSYFWTAMMCSAYAGKEDVVTYLIARGAAWVGVCNTQGKDALMLAEEAGHQDIVKLLQDSLTGQPEESTPRTQPLDRKYCEVCKAHYQEDSVETHERSTVHLFNKKKTFPSTYYVIPEHNIGFKMMLKEGWNRESGLGPDGTGRKFPVQTVLKRDQKGLGFKSDQKPKVTHFAANDTLAVARQVTKNPRTERVATISKKEERRKEVKSKAWERDLRTYMNIDL
ncbi:G patch domain and ankyrin repeat-containing protein 1 [Pseudophryne corroboree]|uniref:G patch domain and ankyrin repeat-containing protein 1 n=1 Tax=Pseudophryne corroboree TaxID=495146 RepID=UPI003081D620